MGIDFSDLIFKIIFPELLRTLQMVFLTTIYATILGFILAIILIVVCKDGLKSNKYIYGVLDTLINIIRSFPFIILMVTIIPFTRFIVGTSIGEKAAVVPLTITAAPYIARIIESSLKEVDKNLIEVAKSFGASNFQIIFRIMISEGLPSIIAGITLATISILGASAVAGTVGAGGLGAIAITYGYQNFDETIMYGTVCVIIVLVQIIQSLGGFLYNKLK
ncbi:methionine ABC transporter permease [Clostridium coskatii]|uniref:Methionine import system permease protein MetP n=1 Tax=Clostridium coskatii TaxID=1705578 RepID=A0A166UNV9_9CLOT|nr:methionine ABC transporter permease [Clostridium coskatii]OAA95100.1 Methionine import system permease protein MetP [Clostridium coskatii]OBR97552.1 methionine import system permease protein MetP [Clostridium coskatii]